MHEKCAVFGIKSDSDVFDKIYYGLYAMQHRGQESAGIAIYKGKILSHKDIGLVSEVFKNTYIMGCSGIGHVRYSTRGVSEIDNAQPFVINYAKGSFAIAHNGQIANSDELKGVLENRGSVFTTTSDTEVIAHLIVREHIKTNDLVKGIRNAMGYLKGSYSLTLLFEDKIIAVRDPYGIRPLVYGRSGNTHVFASESCALDVLDVELVRDVKPSEILVIGDKVESHLGVSERTAHCMFEYVYFARPDSIINGKSIYDVRKRLGAVLSKEGKVKADVVVPVPDSGITQAIGYSRESGIPFGEGLIKNRYIGRTFILPDHKQRVVSVRVKLNPIKSELKGKDIVLVDDSIVRGTTIKKLIKLLKESGANKVHVRISCPPLKYPCYYGIDMQSRKEFIAAQKSIEEIRDTIKADSLVYTSIKGLVNAIGIPAENLCMACLNCKYPVKDTQTKL